MKAEYLHITVTVWDPLKTRHLHIAVAIGDFFLIVHTRRDKIWLKNA